MPALLSDHELLAKLVAFDSTSHRSNLPIIDFLSDYLEVPGVRLTRNPAPDEPKTNLVVELGPATDPTTRDGLMLSGHVDVVPAEEPEWRTPPFELVAEGDRFYGRGSADMKGFVALAVNALLRARGRHTTLRAPLALVITYDEELGTLGARHFAETWPTERPLPRRAIIGEPTSLEVVRLHKGHTKLALTVKGKPAHSGYPHLGHNAIEPMGRAIVALSELRAALQAEGGPNAEFFPEVPFVPMNLAQVHGGTADNIVPDSCRLMIGYRVMPGMISAPIEERIAQLLAGVLAGEEYQLERINYSPPMELPATSDLYQYLCAMVGQNKTVSASYATDAGWFQTAGFECLLYGPGDIATAHKPNEWLPKAEFVKASSDLDLIIDRFCA